jgi:rhodanese-related sulfurtransferase
MEPEEKLAAMLKKSILFLVLILLAFACFGQVKSGAFRLMLRGLLSHSVPETGVQEAARDSARILFLDAREPDEYAVSHIKNAVFAGYDHFDLKNLPAMAPDQPIVVYCSVGYRSEKIAEKLRAAGYNRVSNLYGGIFEWVNQGFPVYDQNGRTERVHAFDRSWGVWLKKGKKVYSRS